MIKKIPYDVPAHMRHHSVSVCDGCGAGQTPGESGWIAEPRWGRDAYRSVTVESMHHEVGYEGDGGKEGDAWDFCPTCFEEKVRPLLMKLAKPRKVDESW